MNNYIYDLPDWPRFRWNQDVISPRLAAVRHKQDRLIGRMLGLGFTLRKEAELRTLTLEVLKSSEIEGEILDKEQVRSSVARRLGVDIGALTPEDRNVEGVVEMVLDATRNCDKPLTRERMFGWHGSLFPTGYSGLRKITVGTWRGGPVDVLSGPIGHERVPFEGPPADRIEREMTAFLDWFNGDDGTDLLTSSKWAKMAKCSQDTALRDIVDLVDRGILAKDPAGGRSTSYWLLQPE